MRILHVIAGLSDGGTEAVLYRLLVHDTADSHHVISLTDEGKYGARLGKAGVQVTTIGMQRGRLTLRGLYTLWRVVQSTRPDVVQTWMYHADLLGGIAARLARVPVVWGIRNTILDPRRSSRSTIWVAGLCARLSRWLHLVSQPMLVMPQPSWAIPDGSRHRVIRLFWLTQLKRPFVPGLTKSAG